MTDTLDKLAELPHREQDEPFLGYKDITLRLEQGHLGVYGRWGQVTLDATAECRIYPKPVEPHAAPFRTCKCGFYAMKNPDKLWGSLAATVELFGHVIVGEHGWRASRQRILAITCMTVCEGCNLMGDSRRRPDALYFDMGGTCHPLCVDHGAVSQSINAALRMTTGEVASALCVDVGWA